MKRVIIVLLTALAMASCHDKIPTPPKPIGVVERTFFIYMSANNNLINNAYDNVELIKKGIINNNIDGRVVIFWRRGGNSTQVIEIQRSGRGAKEVVLKDYGKELNASDPQTLSMAIEDMKQLAPARNYTLGMWSHALGWMPASAPKRQSSGGAMYSFGDDQGFTPREMNVTDMADAIPDGLLDVIFFDCCYMGNIETLYELRGKANYILASTAEVTAEGTPYDKSLASLFKGTEQGLKEACDIYYENSYPGFAPTRKHGVMALYDMSNIEDVATAYANIVKSVGQETIYNLPPISWFNTQDSYATEKVQRYDRTSTGPWAYDMVQVVDKSMAADTVELKEALEKFVIHNRYAETGYVFIPKGTSAGVTLTPLTNHLSKSWRDFYLTLDWHKATFAQ